MRRIASFIAFVLIGCVLYFKKDIEINETKKTPLTFESSEIEHSILQDISQKNPRENLLKNSQERSIPRETGDYRWKELLGRNLSHFQGKGVGYRIEEEMITDQRKGDYKQAVITYRFPGGKENSFRALVDPTTGAVVRTWDRTIHEKKNPVRFTLPE